MKQHFIGRAKSPGFIAALIVIAGMGAGMYGWLNAADHEDSPVVQGDQAADIADVFTFASPENPDRLVIAMTLSDVSPAAEIQLGQSAFDPEVLYQFKIDNDGDAVEDLVIQAYAVGTPSDQTMLFEGPAVPSVTGAQARILGGTVSSVAVSTGAAPQVATSGNMRMFAGVRDDPFFFDFGQFLAVVDDINSGNGASASFNDPGTDSFAGLNVYSIVVEVPLSDLGASADDLSVWATTNRR